MPPKRNSTSARARAGAGASAGDGPSNKRTFAPLLQVLVEEPSINVSFYFSMKWWYHARSLVLSESAPCSQYRWIVISLLIWPPVSWVRLCFLQKCAQLCSRRVISCSEHAIYRKCNCRFEWICGQVLISFRFHALLCSLIDAVSVLFSRTWHSASDRVTRLDQHLSINR